MVGAYRLQSTRRMFRAIENAYGQVLPEEAQRYLPNKSKLQAKKMFAGRRAEIMLCTDAAAEGLNFQFCGAIVNYDRPWNPMKVEQRIGRIDRLGQEFEQIRIVNLHYENTVEADIYLALRDRIELFQTFVGRLQPILTKLPRAIAEVTLGARGDQDYSYIQPGMKYTVRVTTAPGLL